MIKKRIDTKDPLNRKEFILGTVNLAHYPWLVKPRILEENPTVASPKQWNV